MSDIEQSSHDLLAALRRGERVVCLHYACENFFEVTDRPVAVTCIGWSEPTISGGVAQERAFSIANSVPSEDVQERERDLLTRFYDLVRSIPDARFVHWNMHRSSYGFVAIEERYRHLFRADPPATFPQDRLYDLDSILGARFGDDFVKHPKLRTLCTMNGLWMPHFKPGLEESKAIATGDYGLIERSTAEKAHLIALLLLRFASGQRRTQNSVGAVPFAKAHLDAVEVVLTLGHRFLYVERELRHRRENRATLEVKDEYDAQDLIRSLLALFFDDVRPEDVAPAFAGASSRVDFVLPDFELAVELKHTRTTLDDKKLGEELLVDRERYATRQGVRHLVCLVFDHDGRLRNPRGLENDLSRATTDEAIAVTVKILDR
jgi:hypothetical protein